MIDLAKVQNSGIHDYEVAEIQVNYTSACISICFKSPGGNGNKLIIQNFTTFEITHKEEWGKGKYVCASDITYDDVSKSYLLEIVLNSGDKIVVRYIAE